MIFKSSSKKALDSIESEKDSPNIVNSSKNKHSKRSSMEMTFQKENNDELPYKFQVSYTSS